MRIVNEKTLDLFRGPGVCDWCKKMVRQRDPHHIFSRGAGGPDLKCNIAALCATFGGGENCHRLLHDGHIDDHDILAVVAMREDCLQGDIEDFVNLIRYRMPKIGEVTEERFRQRCERELNFGARRLAFKELESFRHLLRKET